MDTSVGQRLEYRNQLVKVSEWVLATYTNLEKCLTEGKVSTWMWTSCLKSPKGSALAASLTMAWHLRSTRASIAKIVNLLFHYSLPLPIRLSLSYIFIHHFIALKYCRWSWLRVFIHCLRICKLVGFHAWVPSFIDWSNKILLVNPILFAWNLWLIKLNFSHGFCWYIKFDYDIPDICIGRFQLAEVVEVVTNYLRHV